MSDASTLLRVVDKMIEISPGPTNAQINSATDPDILFFYQYHRLRRLCESASRFAHLEAAGVLRLFLLDEHPLVHQANKQTRLKFQFGIARDMVYRFSEKLSTFGTPKTVGRLTMKVGTPDLFSLDQFLAEPFLKRDNIVFSVKELILHAANKIGGVHFDTKLAHKFSDLHQCEPDSEVVIRISLLGIAQLVLEALQPLAEKLNPMGPHEVFLAHWDAADGSVIFQGAQSLESKNWKDAALPNGFAWVSRLRVGNQIRDPSVIYAMEGQQGEWSFFISVTTGRIKVHFKHKRSGREEEISADSGNLHELGFYETWFTFGAAVTIRPDFVSLRIRFGAYLHSEASVEGREQLRPADSMVMGADIRGGNEGAVSFKDLIILRDPSEVPFSRAFEYLELKHG